MQQTSPSVQTGLAENLAGLLCYALGWVTGLIFILIDKRPFVRFHAAQSIVVFGGLHILNMVIGIGFGAGWMMMGGRGLGAFGIGWMLYGLVGIATFVLWIVLMIKAYQGERFRVPIAADLAESFTGK